MGKCDPSSGVVFSSCLAVTPAAGAYSRFFACVWESVRSDARFRCCDNGSKVVSSARLFARVVRSL